LLGALGPYAWPMAMWTCNVWSAVLAF
jgi:hypothetical protein